MSLNFVSLTNNHILNCLNSIFQLTLKEYITSSISHTLHEKVSAAYTNDKLIKYIIPGDYNDENSKPNAAKGTWCSRRQFTRVRFTLSFIFSESVTAYEHVEHPVNSAEHPNAGLAESCLCTIHSISHSTTASLQDLSPVLEETAKGYSRVVIFAAASSL